MKKLIIGFVCVAIFCFGFARNPRSSRPKMNLYAASGDSIYEVYKIDSLNNFYLVYARDGRRVYKIVSQKSMGQDCRNIFVGKAYRFGLHSYLFYNGKALFTAASISHVSGWMVDSVTVIPFEGDSIRDIFSADNIKGLCVSN